MITKVSMVETFGNLPKRSNICPECGDAQVLKWDNVGDGENIALISSSHKECKKTVIRRENKMGEEGLLRKRRTQLSFGVKSRKTSYNVV